MPSTGNDSTSDVLCDMENEIYDGAILRDDASPEATMPDDSDHERWCLRLRHAFR